MTMKRLPLSGLLCPPMFRKFSAETVNAAYTKKAPARSQPIFKLESPRLSFQDWFPCRDIAPDLAADLFRDFVWRRRQKDYLLPSKFTKYRHSGHFLF
jgi:hypothetical protein